MLIKQVTKKYFLPPLEVKSRNAMINGQNIFYQSLKNSLITYDNF